MEGAKIYKTSSYRCTMSIWCFTNGSKQSWNFAGFALLVGITCANSNQMCWGWKNSVIWKVDRVAFQHGRSKNGCVGNAMQLHCDGSWMLMFAWKKDFYKKPSATRSLINVYT
jgi:hypothetical protein